LSLKAISIGYQEFDDFFLKWIPNSPLAQRMFARLKPVEALTWKLPQSSPSANNSEPQANVPEDVTKAKKANSQEFDLTRSCDYVYRAKWILNLKKRPRMTEVDGNPMVSVVDMMYIHGDYKTEASCRDRWRDFQGNHQCRPASLPFLAQVQIADCPFFRYIGKEELKELMVHEVEPANGGNLIAFISFWDFDGLVLPLIKKGLAAELRTAWGFIGTSRLYYKL